MKKYLQAATACSAVYNANAATLWSNDGSSCSDPGWSYTNGGSCATYDCGSPCMSTSGGTDMSFVQYVNTKGYDDVRIRHSLLTEFEGKDDGCYVKYSTDAGSSWTTAGTYEQKDKEFTDVELDCNGAADDNQNFRVKFETVKKDSGGSDYCNWWDMFVEGTFIPTRSPTNHPTRTPTNFPSKIPSKTPSKSPSKSPTDPSSNPTISPTKYPTNSPSKIPTKTPSKSPTNDPTNNTNNPSISPTKYPTKYPTINPTKYPTASTHNPSTPPTQNPTRNTYNPSTTPTQYPSVNPTKNPTPGPTYKSGHVEDIITTNTGEDGGGGGNMVANAGVTSPVGIIIGVISFLFCVCMGIFVYFRIKKRNKHEHEWDMDTNKRSHLQKVQSVSVHGSTYSAATNGTGTAVQMVNHSNLSNNYQNNVGIATNDSDAEPSLIEMDACMTTQGGPMDLLENMIINNINNDPIIGNNNEGTTKGDMNNEDSVDNVDNMPVHNDVYTGDNEIELEEGGYIDDDDDDDNDIINQIEYVTPMGPGPVDDDMIIGGNDDDITTKNDDDDDEDIMDDINHMKYMTPKGGNDDDDIELEEGGNDDDDDDDDDIMDDINQMKYMTPKGNDDLLLMNDGIDINDDDEQDIMNDINNNYGTPMGIGNDVIIGDDENENENEYDDDDDDDDEEDVMNDIDNYVTMQ